MPSLPVACDLCHIPHLPGVSEERTSGSNPSQGSVRAVLPRRGWVGWIEEHSKILGAISVWVFVAFGGIGALVASASGGGHSGAPIALAPGNATSSAAPVTTPGSSAASPKTGKVGTGKTNTNSTPTGSNGQQTPTGSGNNGQTTQTHPGKITNGPVAQPAGSCSPTQPMVNGKPETGITRGTVTIGEILSDVNQLPQQLRPSYEGLSAWADLVKHSGGICGRDVQILERNDDALPNQYTSAYQSMSSQVFSFVATESLQDGAEYKSSRPF